MKKITLLAVVALLMAMAMPMGLAGAVQVPYCDSDADPSDDDCDLELPANEEGQVNITTPCGQIIVTGDDWSPGTEIFIDREFDNADCPGEGPARDVDTTVPESADGEAAEGDAAAADTVTVAEDGTFIATLQVPADAVDTYEVTVRGTDLSGEAKEQVYTYEVSEASSFSPATSESSDSGVGSTSIALAALVAAVVLAIGFNWSSLVTRRRR